MPKGKRVPAPKAGEEWTPAEEDRLLALWFATNDQGTVKIGLRSISYQLERTVNSVETQKNKLIGHTIKPDSGKAYAHYSPGPSRLSHGDFYREGKGWSKRDLDALSKLRKAGMSPGYIAGILARSEEAVKDKITELNRTGQRTLWDTEGIAEERKKTAQYRFFLYKCKPHETYPFSVCDQELVNKTIARFKTIEHAELFLSAVQSNYVNPDA